MAEPGTINDLLAESVRRHGPRPALGMAFGKALTYSGLGESVAFLAAALRDLGLGPGQTAAILAENSPQWGIAYLAITACGGVAVPILPDFPEADVHHILREAGVRLVFTTSRQVDKLTDFLSHPLGGLITLDNSDPEGREATATFAALISRGAALLGARPVPVPPPPRAEDTASIIYTSGTSGHAKAVLLSHANLLANVRSAGGVMPIPPGTCFLSILPLSHTYEFTLGFVLPLSQGARVVYADRRPTPVSLEKICRHERPQVICSVPMVMEKIYKKKALPVINGTFWLRQLVKLPLGRRLVLRGIGRRLRDFFGGGLELMAIGGAALNRDTENFLRQAGFPFVVGYGLTETAPLLAAGPFGEPTVACGSVGRPVPGVEIRIDQPDPATGIGQIMARGANVMQGYYQNPALTRETIDTQGWLATGDLGVFDEHGNLYVSGRMKSVIVLSHGENIYPEGIEDKINAFPQVLESLVVGRDDRLEALVYLDYELVDSQAPSRDGQRLYVQQVLEEIKTAVNQQLPLYSRLAQVRERTEPFVKTATHKIKRYLYQ